MGIWFLLVTLVTHYTEAYSDENRRLLLVLKDQYNSTIDKLQYMCTQAA